MTERELVLQWTPWTLAFSLLCFLVTLAISWEAMRRWQFRPKMVALELLRLALVGGALLLLNQPEWVERYRPDQKPAIVLLADTSASMETRDVVEGIADSTEGAAVGGMNSQARTRREALSPWIDPTAWDSLRERFDVLIESSSDIAKESQDDSKTTDSKQAGSSTRGDAATDDRAGTNLHDLLVSARQRHPNLQAVLLASDGDWNQGPAPVQAALQYRTAETPIWTIPLGSPSRLPDLELLSLDAPTFGIAGKAVRIPFTIESSLPRAIAAKVILKASDGQEITHDLRIAPMGRTSDAVVWKPEGIGDYTLTLEVPQQPGEVISENNSKTVPIAIREEKLKVLVVESLPRWEYRYLRNALSRDPGVEVSCLLFHPGLGKVGGGNKDYLQAFPETLEALAAYDVVFLGDVGIADGQLTVEQCRLLKGLVEQQASGLVFMPGWQGHQSSLLETELADLYPVLLDPAQPEGWGTRTPSHFELTESGRRSLLTKLADTQDETTAVWEKLPGFQWYAPVLRAKPGSEVLAVHQEASNAFGRIPLLATRTFGSGKVLFMGTDGAWRWRKGVEDLYHYRFWGQVVRWMAYQRNMAKGESMRLYYSPEQPQVRQTISLQANVMDRTGEPMQQGDVRVRIESPSGQTEGIRLAAQGGEWGAFAGLWTANEPGPHRVTLRSDATDTTLETTIFVQGSALEQIGKPARPEVLEELARVSKGEVVRWNQRDKLIESLQNLPQPPDQLRRLQLWSNPWVAGMMISGLAIFWISRKWLGLF
ncbi:MAG: hypothetical protein ACK523_19505 [Pirellulaceae bacterium]|jgi:hypothetical protein